MILEMYSVFDSVALAYNQPFFTANDGMAVRIFSDNVNSVDSVINKHPEEYSLYRVGKYDDSNGAIEPCDPELIITANIVKNPPDSVERQIEWVKAELASLVDSVKELKK